MMMRMMMMMMRMVRSTLLSAEEDLSVQRGLGVVLGISCLPAASFALLLLLLLLPLFALALGQLQQAL